ncbi:hypothetical protein OF83DRAFT_1149216, partial [Amylostereum chailletii]
KGGLSGAACMNRNINDNSSGASRTAAISSFLCARASAWLCEPSELVLSLIQVACAQRSGFVLACGADGGVHEISWSLQLVMLGRQKFGNQQRRADAWEHNGLPRPVVAHGTDQTATSAAGGWKATISDTVQSYWYTKKQLLSEGPRLAASDWCRAITNFLDGLSDDVRSAHRFGKIASGSRGLCGRCHPVGTGGKGWSTLVDGA